MVTTTATTEGHPVAEPNPTAPPVSLWTQKPWWCQPWSILLTGSMAMVGSWWLLRLWWITAPVALGVLVWWWLFLVLVPAAYRDQNRNL